MYRTSIYIDSVFFYKTCNLLNVNPALVIDFAVKSISQNIPVDGAKIHKNLIKVDEINLFSGYRFNDFGGYEKFLAQLQDLENMRYYPEINDRRFPCEVNKAEESGVDSAIHRQIVKDCTSEFYPKIVILFVADGDHKLLRSAIPTKITPILCRLNFKNLMRLTSFKLTENFRPNVVSFDERENIFTEMFSSNKKEAKIDYISPDKQWGKLYFREQLNEGSNLLYFHHSDCKITKIDAIKKGDVVRFNQSYEYAPVKSSYEWCATNIEI